MATRTSGAQWLVRERQSKADFVQRGMKSVGQLGFLSLDRMDGCDDCSVRD